jgi:hypothetical protein
MTVPRAYEYLNPAMVNDTNKACGRLQQPVRSCSELSSGLYWSSLMMEAVRTFETSVDDHFTRQYNPEDSSEHRRRENLKSHTASTYSTLSNGFIWLRTWLRSE